MDTIPVSIAIAQAANESGWGTSRFALEGNALFGQWTWSKKGISPKNKDPNQSHKILQFQVLKASVRAYKNNLNTHNAYKEFREARARLRQENKTIAVHPWKRLSCQLYGKPTGLQLYRRSCYQFVSNKYGNW